MKIERSIIRRDADRPELAQGDRFQLEMDPEQVGRMLSQARGLVKELNALFAKSKPRQRRRPRTLGRRSQ